MDSQEFYTHIANKLRDSPELQDQIDKHIHGLTEIFGTTVEIAIVYNETAELYRDVLSNYGEEYLDDLNSSYKLSSFLKPLNNEDQNLSLCIDPIYLNEGVNEIENILLTTYNENLIMVPITKKSKKEDE